MAVTDKSTVEKFNEAMKALGSRILFRSDLLTISNTLSKEGNIIQQKQVSLLEELVGLTRSHLDFIRDTKEDQTRNDDLNPPTSDIPQPTDDSDRGDDTVPTVDMPRGLSLLTGLALAPFAFQFAKGFVGAITDGLVDLTYAGLQGLAAFLQRPINNMIARFTKAFTFIKDLSNGAGRITSIIGKFATGLGKVASFVGSVFGKIPGMGVFKMLLGRLAWPVTILLGVVDAVKSFMNTEGSFIEKFAAGVGGFFASIVGAPLDLLKDMVAWVVSKLGFTETAEAISEFSFSDTIRSLFGGIYGFVSDAVEWVKGMFSWAVEGIAAGWTNLTDYVSGVWTSVKTWFTEMFSWASTSIATGWTNLTDFISGIWTDVKTWFTDKFSWENITSTVDFFGTLIDDTVKTVTQWFKDAFAFLPSLQDIKDSLYASLPEWAQSGITYLASDSGPIVEPAPETYNEFGDQMLGMRTGGIVDAPTSGGLAVLHGTEAVIPLDSPRAANKINALSQASSRMASSMFNNISPTQVNNGGNMNNSNNSNTTIIHNSVDAYRSLDPALAR